MDEFSNIWIEQCEAARGIREDWGTRKALGYLVGEKLLNYIQAADSDPSWETNVPKFAAEIRQIFTDEELQAYFATATRIGVTDTSAPKSNSLNAHERLCSAAMRPSVTASASKR